MQVTSLEQLKNIKTTTIVELPQFEDGTPFVAELKKPNMLSLMAAGKIPNSLLNIASDMFQKGRTQQVIDNALEDSNSMKELFSLLNVLAKATLVKPSYSELQNAGIELNEQQLSAILAFAQGGVTALERFCKQ